MEQMRKRSERKAGKNKTKQTAAVKSKYFTPGINERKKSRMGIERQLSLRFAQGKGH